MSPRDIREVRIVFDVSDDLRVASSDPEEGGEVFRTGGTSVRGTSPEVIPEDRLDEGWLPWEVGLLYCRGPFEFTRGGGDYPYYPSIKFRRNETEAGTRGEKLAPGTCALQGRPLSSDEPTSIRFPSVDAWDRYTAPPSGGAEYERQRGEYDRAFWLGDKIRLLAWHQFSLSWFSNLITRSDYVTILGVRKESSSFVTGERELGAARYIPFTE